VEVVVAIIFLHLSFFLFLLKQHVHYRKVESSIARMDSAIDALIKRSDVRLTALEKAVYGEESNEQQSNVLA
jgi:hypothetical protein